MDTTGESMHKERTKEMERHIFALERVIKLMPVINSTLELSALLDIIVEVAAQLTDTESASVMLIDEDTGELRFAAIVGQQSADIKPVSVPFEGSLTGTVARENKPLLIRNTKDDPRWNQNVDLVSGFVTRSMISVPLELHGEVIGVVNAVNKLHGAEPSWGDVEILSQLATQAAIAINNARLLAKLQDAYDELNELDRRKSDFIAIAAHELRTPLALILGYASFLREDASGKAKEQMEVVLQSALRLRSLIDDMVNLREVDSGQAVLELECFSLQDLVRASIKEIEYIAEAKEQALSLSMPETPILVEADRNKMTLTLVNLLSNAVKFTDSGKRFGVQVQANDHSAWVTVWDTGAGIPADQLDRIFDRFYQVEGSLLRRYEGMGLGLSIVKEMIELHHGEVTVQSQLGQGTAFTVTIPIRQT